MVFVFLLDSFVSSLYLIMRMGYFYHEVEKVFLKEGGKILATKKIS